MSFNTSDYQSFWGTTTGVESDKAGALELGDPPSKTKKTFFGSPGRKCQKSEEQRTNVGRITFGMIFNVFDLSEFVQA